MSGFLSTGYFLCPIRISGMESKRATDLVELTEGSECILAFWSPDCSFCPSHLDKLEIFAGSSLLRDYQVFAICCGDPEMGMIKGRTQTGLQRWHRIQQYYASPESVELIKGSVDMDRFPWYVVVDSSGMVMRSASDFDMSQIAK